MDYLNHPSTPSVGSLTNKILAINPRLNVHQIIAIVRQCVVNQARIDTDFRSAETIDEGRALELARATLQAADRNA